MDGGPSSDTESERWEDFFGSSTEFSSTLLGLYDSLTSTLELPIKIDKQQSTKPSELADKKDNDSNNTEILRTIKGFQKKNNRCCDSITSNVSLSDSEINFSTINVDFSKVICDSQLTSPCNKLNSKRRLHISCNNIGKHINDTSEQKNYLKSTECGSRNNIFKQKNIKVLSPNVQRIITHSDAEHVDSIDIEAIKSNPQPHIQTNLNGARGSLLLEEQPMIHLSSKSLSKNIQKFKTSNLPLSKITCKLTQSGYNLVDTLDSISGCLDPPSFSEWKREFNYSTNKDKKLQTNSRPITVEKNHPSKLVYSTSVENMNNIGIEKEVSAAQSENLSSTSMSNLETDVKTRDSNDFSHKHLHSEPTETHNFTLSQNLSNLKKVSKGGTFEGDWNKSLISKPLKRSHSITFVSNRTTFHLNGQSNNFAEKESNVLVAEKKVGIQNMDALQTCKTSSKSLDRLADIKSKLSPKESRKSGTLVMPEIAKLKHRPLSSVSICSTSSSSSSGSELTNSKLTTNYLASVESLADQSESEFVDPHSGMSVFERACLEIVDSEKNYVGDLGQVIRGYLMDWKERACLRLDELTILFSNIEEIYEFNRSLLQHLQTSEMDPVKIAKCFIDFRDGFDVYTKYCTQYPEAISLLTKLLQATHTNSLLNSTQKLLQHTLPLGSYLLKPVQRILKYHLLLDNLRKHCEFKEVFQAYEIMRQVARNIDQVKKKLEQQSRVKELSGILDGWLGPELTVLGELRQEGLLMEHNKPRMVFLFATMLIITKSKEDSRLQFKSYIHQNNLMLSEHLPGEPTSFYVIPYDEPRNQIKLTAKNRDQKRLWAQHIKEVILEKFDIPNRAKELVYKLGDEDDRTPDKTPRKWTLHSNHSTTPTYLERRNQYRRSEIRNRNKFKRKTLAAPPVEGFNEVADHFYDTSKKSKSLSRNNSIDESVLPAFQKIAAAVRSKHKYTDNNGKKIDKHEVIVNDVVGTSRNDMSIREACMLSKDIPTPKPMKCSYKTLKHRSKSVPRIAFPINSVDSHMSLIENKIKSNDSNSGCKKHLDVEVKQYNNKTLPKRIATIKKQRQKETSKFYLDLADFDTCAPETILKITESTENLTLDSNTEPTKENYIDLKFEKLEDIPPPAPKIKKDADIILEILKNNKDFEKIYNKTPKTRSIDNTKSSIKYLPQSLPCNMSLPLEVRDDISILEKSKSRLNEGEPVYASLIRTAHMSNKIPSLSNQSNYILNYEPTQSVYYVLDNCKNIEECQRRITVADQPLKHVCNPGSLRNSSTSCSSESSSTTLKRNSLQNFKACELIADKHKLFQNSDSINSFTLEAVDSVPETKNIIKRLLNANLSRASADSVLSSSTFKSIDNNALVSSRSSKLPERRVSDVSEMCRLSYLHRQGSEAVGERIAHIDYADPKTLFVGSNASVSEISLQRDSVFSLTSSTDSVCEQKRLTVASIEPSGKFEYEANVEETLENDFRDSAVYSDDNEKKSDSDKNLKRCFKNLAFSLPSTVIKTYPNLPPKPLTIPPAILKPKENEALKNDSGITKCSTHMNQSTSRSWVLQQIENFNK